jgi:hypothetical protein
MRTGRIFAAITALWLVQAVPPAVQAAQPASAYVGRWAVQIDGRNLIVLSLETRVGPPPLRGVVMRPLHFSINAQRYVSGVSTPVESQALTNVSLGEGLRFAVQNPRDKSIDQFELDIIGPRSAALKFVDAPAPMSLTMIRVDPQARVALDWDVERIYSAQERHADSPEMARLFAADQADRKDITHINPAALAKGDPERRRAVHALLDNGKLRTGADFFGAAFVFQHSDTPDDHLLAHTLAIVAVKMGQPDALWIAAATLDRYLQEIGKPQVYGTQFQIPNAAARATQEPYDWTVISDSLREELSVPVLKDQETQRAGFDKQYGKALLSPTGQSPR